MFKNDIIYFDLFCPKRVFAVRNTRNSLAFFEGKDL